MTEEEKNQQILDMLKFVEFIDKQISFAHAIEVTPFNQLTPEAWRKVQEVQKPLILLLEKFKKSMGIASKIVDNDALSAHLRTVIEAED